MLNGFEYVKIVRFLLAWEITESSIAWVDAYVGVEMESVFVVKRNCVRQNLWNELFRRTCRPRSARLMEDEEKKKKKKRTKHKKISL